MIFAWNISRQNRRINKRRLAQKRNKTTERKINWRTFNLNDLKQETSWRSTDLKPSFSEGNANVADLFLRQVTAGTTQYGIALTRSTKTSFRCESSDEIPIHRQKLEEKWLADAESAPDNDLDIGTLKLTTNSVRWTDLSHFATIAVAALRTITRLRIRWMWTSTFPLNVRNVSPLLVQPPQGVIHPRLTAN